MNSKWRSNVMGWLRGTRYAVRGDNKEIRIKLIQDYCAHK